MANFNSVTLAGNLTRDPEIKTIAPERVVASFGIAINRRWKGSDGETREEATFVDIECWGRTAELASQYLTKGSSCLLQGRLKLDSWEDKDGSRRNRLRVVADTIQFLDSKQRGAQTNSGEDEGEGETVTRTSSATPARRVQAAGRSGGSTAVLDEPPF